MGVSWGGKWAKGAFVLWQKPAITAPAHRGVSVLKFIEICVVGVRTWRRTGGMSFRDQVCPL